MKIKNKLKYIRRVCLVGIAMLLTLLNSLVSAAEHVMDISGDWRIELDRGDEGLADRWFEKDLPGTDEICLPGSLQERGFGDDPGPETSWTGGVREDEWNKPKYVRYRTEENFRMPFWLQPDKYFKGVAWYQKRVTISEDWKGKHITLELERPHWETRVYVDGQAAGVVDHLSVAHVYDLSRLLKPGEHLLTIRVDNRMVVDVGMNSHSVSDHTQSNWNGLVGRMELKAESAAWIEDLQVYPDAAGNQIKVTGRVAALEGVTGSGGMIFEISQEGKVVAEKRLDSIQIFSGGAVFEMMISLNKPALVWDEFNPVLYTLKAGLQTDAGLNERKSRFGMREIAMEGNRIMLNGRQAFLRGTLECCIFPETGYPPTDIDAWKRIIRICKAHGLNHIRFHSWCPPEAAFIAADELGFYYQVECSSWANQGATLGDDKPVDAWLYREADAILKAYGNHPSFLLFAYGNEPGGSKKEEYLRKWVSHYKHLDPRRLVTSGAGWPIIEENDFHVTHKEARIQGWGEELKSRINSKPPETVSDYRKLVRKYPNAAVIAHEIGQWCVYPDFSETNKYTGVLKARNFEVFSDFLVQSGMGDQARDFLLASGKLQMLCYKEEIESALRTPGFGGFQLLDLHDFPGQGTALVGVLDPFWNSKPYATPAEYRRFCAPVVLLARLPERIFTKGETLKAQVEVSQFGAADLLDAVLIWSLRDASGQIARSGRLEPGRLDAGGLREAGTIEIDLAGLSVPAKYSLNVNLESHETSNDWDIWVYPPEKEGIAEDGIKVADEFDAETIRYLLGGGKVLLAVDPAKIKTSTELGFSSIFWNTAWTQGQAPHTLGILCDPAHPALAGFPTEYHSNWQWSDPVRHGAAMELDHLPAELRPIVQIVPDWFAPKKLGLVFEAGVGAGSLIVCAVNLHHDLEHRPVARQFRRSLLEYMAGDDFSPDVEVSIEQIESLFQPDVPDKSK